MLCMALRMLGLSIIFKPWGPNVADLAALAFATSAMNAVTCHGRDQRRLHLLWPRTSCRSTLNFNAYGIHLVFLDPLCIHLTGRP